MTEQSSLSLAARLYQEAPPPDGLCLLALRGSMTYGTHSGDMSDIDIIGMVIGQPKHYFGLHQWGKKEFDIKRECLEVKQGAWDTVYYEFRKLVGMLLAGNPNVISLLWLRPEDYLLVKPPAQHLIDNRALFLSRHVYNAFGGYAKTQLEKMESRDPADLRDYMALTAEAKERGIHPQHKGRRIPYPDDYNCMTGEAVNAHAHSDTVLLGRLLGYMKKGDNTGRMGDKRKQSILEHSFDRKNASHCVRLLRMALEFKKTGELNVLRPDAEELLDVKYDRSGFWTLARIKDHANQLYAEMEDARVSLDIPDEPDADRVNSLMTEILMDHFKVARFKVTHHAEARCCHNWSCSNVFLRYPKGGGTMLHHCYILPDEITDRHGEIWHHTVHVEDGMSVYHRVDMDYPKE